MNDRAPTPLLWFAVLGGPLAWIVQFVAGFELANAACDGVNGRIKVPYHAWQLGFAIAGILVCLAAEVAALHLFRRSRGTRNRFYEPVSRGDTTLEPVGRIQFMAMLGLTVNPLALTIIVMSAIASPIFGACHQT